MEHEVFNEGISANEIKIGQQEELVGVGAPQPVYIRLETQIVPAAENPVSPSRLHQLRCQF